MLSTEKTIKEITFAIILFGIIEISHFINSKIFERQNGTVINLSEFSSPETLLQIGVLLLALLVCIAPIIIFFTYYFYTNESYSEETGKTLLLVVAVLSGIKKFYCIKCMLAALFTTFLFLIPAFLSIKLAFILSKYIKANNLLKNS